MLCCLYYYYTLWSPHCYVRFCEDIITLQSYWSQRVRLSVYFFPANFAMFTPSAQSRHQSQWR